MKRASSVATFVVALIWLHGIVTLPVPFDAAAWLLAAKNVSPDLLLLLGCVVVAGAAWGRSRLAAAAAGVLLVVATLARHVTVHLTPIFNRPCEFEDARVLPYLWEHVFRPDGRFSHERGEVEAAVALIAAAVLLCYLSARAFLRVTAAASSPRAAAAWLIALQALFATAVLAPRVAMQPFGLGVLAGHSLQAIVYWLDPEAVEAPIRATIEAGARRLRDAPVDLAELEGADVHVLVIESYGAVALRHPELGAHLRSLWRELDGELRAQGCAIATAAVHPAIVGGQSLLSHQELFCALRVPDHRTWSRVLARPDLPALPKAFARAGYHTVEVLPAMPRHWPEGALLYGFAETVTQVELRYAGALTPSMPLPDQFALHHLLERCVRPAQQPLFTAFVSWSSHAPWSFVPGYVADWQIDAATFVATAAHTHAVGWLDVPHDPRLVPAYRDTLEYALRCAIGFTCRLPRPSLVLVLGDHQPPIVRAVLPPDPSYDVPMHAISNRPELLQPLRALGFADGFELPPPACSFPVADVAPALLRAYSGGAPAAK